MAESAFDRLAKKIASRGYSKKSADAIAATIGRRKYGRAGMAAKAAVGRKNK